MDVVGKGQNELREAVVILNGQLRRGVPLGALHIDHVLMERGLVPVAPGGELPDAALVAHGMAGAVLGTLVRNGDGESRVQEGFLPHPGVEGLVIVDQGIENLGVRLEGDLGAGVVGAAHHGHFLGNGPPGEFHFIDFPIFMDPNPHPLRQGVDHGGAHAVKAAGDLVAAAAEFAAGVEDGVHYLQCGPAGLGLDVHRNAPAVVGDGDGVPGVDGDGDVFAVTGQGLVDGVVHDFVHQMVQAGDGGGADVHTRTLPHRLQALQNLNLGRVIGCVHFVDLQFVRHRCPPVP